MGQALDDGGLADAWLADEHRVVLGLAREDADDAADLRVAPDHRVHLAFAGLLHQVAPIALQGFVGRLGVGALHALVAAHGGQGAEECFVIDAQVAEDAGGGAFVRRLEHGHDEVLDGDVLVLEFFRLGVGVDEELLDLLRHGDLPGLVAGPPGARDAGAALQLALEFTDDHVGRPLHAGEEARDQPALLLAEGQQQVLRIHRLVPVLHRDGLGLVDRFLNFLS